MTVDRAGARAGFGVEADRDLAGFDRSQSLGPCRPRMDHTALIYLMDRDGHFVSPFNLKRTPEEAAKDLKRYL